MIRNKFRIIIVLVFLAAAVLLIGRMKTGRQKSISARETVIQPSLGSVLLTVTTTGIVEPQNRLEIKPSISGRVEEILVAEGDQVKTGQVLAWMSSTERAALVDAARSQGEETL